MAQFDVYRNIFGGREAAPFLIELQHDIVDALGIALVAPLRLRDGFAAATRLNPGFVVLDVQVVLVPTQIVSLRRSSLGTPVANLSSERYAILSAVDFMLTGV